MLATPKSRRGDNELWEHGSDRRETSATRVSDDLQFSIFFEFVFEFFFRFIFRFRIGFLSFSADFVGARRVLTSKSDSLRYFASDGQFLRSVRRLEA